MLREFVANQDWQVRQCIISMLELQPFYYPLRLWPLVPRALNIARTHPDDYIRHRLRIQLGGSGPLMAWPETK
jgi:hypothetical protein